MLKVSKTAHAETKLFVKTYYLQISLHDEVETCIEDTL